MKIIDISQEIREDMLVYPGDPKTRIERVSQIPDKEVNLSIIKIGSHTGTHVDSPLHINNKGKSILDLPLNYFYGKCLVLDLTYCDKKIDKKDLEKLNIQENTIILLKTKNSEISDENFNKDYVYLTEEAAEYLVNKKTKALGIDYLSVNKFDSNDKVHEILLEKMPIIEGLKLKNVDSGYYIFSGFPLKIKLDGSPIRAVLIKE